MYDIPQSFMDHSEEIDNGYLNDDEVDEEIEIIDESEFLDNDEEDAEDHEPNGSSPNDDDSKLVFEKHKESVFCCDVDSAGRIVVSGSQDDKAYAWDFTTGNIIFECPGHKDSVLSVGFSLKDSYVATADMHGFIQVWKNTGEKVQEYETSDVNWLHWHPVADNVLLVGTNSGEVWMWKIDDFNCKTFQSTGVSCEVGQCTWDGLKLVSGYENGVIKIWDLKTASILHSTTGQNSHSQSVTALDIKKDNSLIVTGSLDSTAKLLNCHTGKAIATFECGIDSNDESTERENSVESVAFCNNLPVVATGTINGEIETWDISAQTRRNIFHHEGGISKLLWCPTNPFLLYTAGLDGSVKVWDGRNGNMQASRIGHKDNILDLKFIPNSNLIVTTSEDSTCRIFEIP